MIIAMVDTSEHSVEIYRAGHNHPILIPSQSAAKLKELKTTGFGIGLDRHGTAFRKSLKNKLISLNNGDSLVFYTDGLVEASNYGSPDKPAAAPVNFFGEERLFSILENLKMKNPDNIIRKINSEIRKFHGGIPLIDDMTLLVLRRE
jgi:sigma-B regulation protein RsbU (phosphoserine phosphatase)